MRLPSDATLIVIDADAAERGATPAAVIVGHIVDVWRSVALPIVPARPAASAFAGTDLDARLTERGCTTLVVCGCDLEGAVEATARDAAALGYRLFVVAQAAEPQVLERLKRAGARIVDWRTAWIAAKGAGWGNK